MNPSSVAGKLLLLALGHCQPTVGSHRQQEWQQDACDQKMCQSPVLQAFGARRQAELEGERQSGVGLVVILAAGSYPPCRFVQPDTETSSVLAT